MTLTKDALIEMIRDKVGYPVKEAKEILEVILEEVKPAPQENGSIPRRNKEYYQSQRERGYAFTIFWSNDFKRRR